MAALTRQGSSLGSQLYESFYDFFSGLYSQSFAGEGTYPGAQTRYMEAENQPPRRPNGAEQKGTTKEAHQSFVPAARTTVPFGTHAALDEIDWPDRPEPARRRSPSVESPSRIRVAAQLPQSAARGDREDSAADQEDLLDQHVNYYLRKRPEACRHHTISRTRQGVYQLDGREVEIQWQYSADPGGQGFLVVVDGPLCQPFADYMEHSEANARWEGQNIGTSSLHLIPRERRISFNDTHKVYNRLEAMKVAKEQALFREKAANFVKEGQDVPQELMTKYKKTIQQKLGQGRRPQSPRRSREAAEGASAEPAPPAAPAPPVREARAAPPPPPPAAPVATRTALAPSTPSRSLPAPATGLSGSPAPMQWPSYTPSYSPALSAARTPVTYQTSPAASASYAPPMQTRPYSTLPPASVGNMVWR